MGRHYDRGLALYNLRRYQEAAHEFTEELKQDPQSSEAYGMRGMALLQLKRYKESRQDLETAIATNPEWSFPYYLASVAHLVQKRVRDAEKMIHEALRLDQRASYFHQLALVELSRDRLAGAYDATEAALRLDPHAVDTLVLRAELLGKLGRLDEARELLHKALAVDPEDPDAHRQLGSVNLLRGSAHQALDHLVEARRINPVKYNDRRLLASAYGRLQWPFNRLSKLSAWLEGCSVQQRWWLVNSAMSLLIFVLMVTAPDFTRFSWPAAVTFALVANGLMLLGTYPSFATLAAFVTLRRQLDMRWHDYFKGFFEIPLLVLGHGFATFAAGLLTAVPSLYYFVFAMIALNWDALWLLMRMNFLLAIVVLPLVGFGFLLLALGGAISMPDDGNAVWGNWLIVLVVSHILMSARRILFRPPPATNPLQVVTP
jgi:tetratricopeptide (TPR) repeat protein